jgi:hypothetical protein
MKQIFFLALLLSSVCFSSYGQLTKNIWLVGGSGSIYSYNEDYTAPSVNVTAKYTSIDLNASVGYFFLDKMCAGLRPYFSTFKGESSGGGSSNDLKFALGPFLRYYFLEEDKQFNLLTDISYQIGINKSFAGSKPQGKYNTLSIMAGTEIFFNSSIGLEILLGYKNQIASFDNSPSAYNSNRRGFQTTIGFQFHLEKD